MPTNCRTFPKSMCMHAWCAYEGDRRPDRYEDPCWYTNTGSQRLSLGEYFFTGVQPGSLNPQLTTVVPGCSAARNRLARPAAPPIDKNMITWVAALRSAVKRSSSRTCGRCKHSRFARVKRPRTAAAGPVHAHSPRHCLPTQHRQCVFVQRQLQRSRSQTRCHGSRGCRRMPNQLDAPVHTPPSPHPHPVHAHVRAHIHTNAPLGSSNEPPGIPTSQVNNHMLRL